MGFKKATKGSRLQMEGGGCGGESSGFLKGRWPRQETLALLEIRTRLHPEFQQAAAASHLNRAPLWDEVSRIMAEEFGYQRSGKKCKEKLGNLYKYYKKTKGGANEGCNNISGRHYRFFKQLDALYGENNANHAANDTHCLQSIWENQDELDNSTSSDEGGDEEIKEMMERQMRRLMQVQESWYEKMLGAVERIEQERARREEAWKEQETARCEREERVWACERAWIRARDAVLMNALQKVGCKCAPLSTTCSDQEEVKESHEHAAMLMREEEEDDGEIADLIRIQSWVQPEIGYN